MDEKYFKVNNFWKTGNKDCIEIPPINFPICGRIQIPGSKSLTSRALMCAVATRQGEINLSNILKCDDTWWAISALKKLGAIVEIQNENIRIKKNSFTAHNSKIYIGSSGILGRFLPGLLCAYEGDFEIRSSNQLSNRPLLPLIKCLQHLGGDISFIEEKKSFPLKIRGKLLDGGEINITAKDSSQFASGFLMAAPLMKKPTVLKIHNPVRYGYINLTKQVMQFFGINLYEKSESEIHISPQEYRACDMNIEADASTASYFAALAAVTGGEIILDKLNKYNSQPDYKFLCVLEKMGCIVKRESDYSVVKGPKKLKGSMEFDFKDIADTALTIGAIAPFADGPIKINGISHIKNHESDRVKNIVRNLKLIGINAKENKDGFIVHPGKPRSASLDTYDDHRVAMSFTLTGLAGAGITLKGASCVSKTCPSFFDKISSLGVKLF